MTYPQRRTLNTCVDVGVRIRVVLGPLVTHLVPRARAVLGRQKLRRALKVLCGGRVRKHVQVVGQVDGQVESQAPLSKPGQVVGQATLSKSDQPAAKPKGPDGGLAAWHCGAAAVERLHKHSIQQYIKFNHPGWRKQ